METKKIKLGRVGFVPKGAYSPDVTYGRMHVVTYKNTTYWSKQEGNTGHEPLGEDEWWGILVDGQAAYAGALNANEATVRANTAAKKAEQTNTVVVVAEQMRESAETERNIAEEQRKAQAQSNAEAEQARADAEQSRVEAETQRVEAEERRASEETLRAAAEDTRKSDEADRIAGETSREQQEDSRVAAEQTRDAQETQRNIDETKRAGAEKKRADAEDARKEAETGRVSAEKSRVAAESQRVEAEERRASELKDVKKQVENKADLVDGKVPLAQLGNIDTQVMLVVDKLPNTDIKANKIYLVKNTDSTEDQNVYTEYVYVNLKWEKVGEFKPEVDLSHIEQKLDTKADLDKAGYVKVEQLSPAITYDEETNSINGTFRFIKLDKLDNIVKNENPANGWQYYDFDDMLDDYFVPQYIYDATADEHIEITDTIYLDDINDGNGGDAFNTAKPLDLTHDLYLDNERIGELSKIRKLDFLKDTIKNSIFVGGRMIEDLDESYIDHSIVFQSLNNYEAYRVKIKNSIIIGAGEELSIAGNATIADNIILSTQGDVIGQDKCVLIGHCENINTLANGSVLIGQNTLAQGKCISIGSLCSNKNGIVIGMFSQAGINSVTIGNNANVYEYHNNNVCIGYSTKCNRYSVAVGNGATATGEQSIAIGCNANSKNKYSISIGSSFQSVVSNPYIIIGNFAKLNAPNDYSYYCIGGYKDDTTYYNIEETLIYNNQHKKYIYGIGGYDGTNSAAEGIKSLQEVLADKADVSAIPTKLSQLINDSNFAGPNDVAVFAGLTIHNNAKIKYLQKTGDTEGTYLTAEALADRVANKVYAADGSLFDVSKLVKKVQCNVSGDPNNIEFGYTTVDGTYNYAVVPTVTTKHSGIMTAADKVKLDKLQELVELKIVGTSESSVAMKPNKVYEITVGSALTITLEEPTDKTVYNEYQGTFDTGDTIPIVTFPSNVRWNDTPKVGANQHVEFSIRYSGGKYYGIFQVWDMTK